MIEETYPAVCRNDEVGHHMGQILKQLSPETTRYYWYPGDRKDYVRAAVAITVGALAYAAMHLVTHTTLMPAVVGTSLTTVLAGFNFGRRDSRAIAGFAELAGAGQDKYAARLRRRQAIAHSGRAAWRGFAEGTGGAAAAVLIANLSATGIVANWLLPLVPAVLGALAHQMGMLVERMTAQPSRPEAEPIS
jgi:hypothetical protein